MSKEALQDSVLRALHERGRIRPADLVERVARDARVPEPEVSNALRGLVERRLVGLNWHGEFQAASRDTRR
jgi:hypothetical protein